ncbi:hypothetical protein DN730_06860 [Marinomonas piezotolerans]|uniref:Uncharacterized protein n=1 Tax=Marinomonas piezotolerans TaxID=2213058 RepID=A0A370UBZ3_9GAMM|nr:hypothetical protein [Marinomonas piezotolerans]RDL45322.1 hypothetical protein DN730_06860 [Marinomonas piezotolerans]
MINKFKKINDRSSLNYFHNLNKAFLNSLNNNIILDNPTIINANFKKTQDLINIIKMISYLYNERLKENSYGNCISENVFYYDILADHFRENNLSIGFNMTVGNLYIEGKKAFFSSEEHYISKIKKPNKTPQKEKIHCWLTLTTGDIIDFTILTTDFISSNGKHGRKGDILFGKPNQNGELGRYTYQPIFFGSNYLKQSGLIL